MNSVFVTNLLVTNFVLFQMKNKTVPQNFTEIATEVMAIQIICSAKYPGVVLDEKCVGMSMLIQFVKH